MTFSIILTDHLEHPQLQIGYLNSPAKAAQSPI